MPSRRNIAPCPTYNSSWGNQSTINGDKRTHTRLNWIYMWGHIHPTSPLTVHTAWFGTSWSKWGNGGKKTPQPANLINGRGWGSKWWPTGIHHPWPWSLGSQLQSPDKPSQLSSSALIAVTITKIIEEESWVVNRQHQLADTWKGNPHCISSLQGNPWLTRNHCDIHHNVHYHSARENMRYTLESIVMRKNDTAWE